MGRVGAAVLAATVSAQTTQTIGFLPGPGLHQGGCPAGTTTRTRPLNAQSCLSVHTRRKRPRSAVLMCDRTRYTGRGGRYYAVSSTAAINEVAGHGDFNPENRKGIFRGLYVYWDYLRWLWRTTSGYHLDVTADKAGITERVLAATNVMEALDRDAGEKLRQTELGGEYDAALWAARELKARATRPSESGNQPVDNPIARAVTMLNNTMPVATVPGVPGILSDLTAVSSPANKRRLSTLTKRIRTGITMGGVATIWIFSGNWVFAAGFLMQSILAQLEYYRMAMQKGHLPARRISLVATALLFAFACGQPHYHNYVLPNIGFYIMLYFLLIRSTPATIGDISTTFMGVFYSAYLPSFWVRLRCLGRIEPSKWVALLHLKRVWPSWAPALIPPPDLWTQGAVITWWTYMSIVASDVGAYFVGKAFGKTKLSTFSKSAGYASPNKTVQGLLGGMAASVAMSVFGGWMLNWPMWYLTGAMYGIMLCLVGLVGDLTASMFKRDAGFKDSGNLLPGHGGYLDRVDSYMFSAPPAYLFVTVLLPLVARLEKVLF